jgi:1-acyl-sn-glycerol-3-phosphate acyltransferase
MRFLRSVLKTILLLVTFVAIAWDFFIHYKLKGRAASIPARAEWLNHSAKRLLKLLKVRLTWEGTPPTNGVLISNHLSYVDILTLGTISPVVFLAKKEVRSWPIIGWLTQCAGTLFIHREKKGDVVPVVDEMARVVKEGVAVTLFLEGTSTGGDVVLAFRSSLLAAAESYGWPVTPAWIHYTMKNGSVMDEVCYWRDMTLFPHLINLLGKKDGFEAHVCFGQTITEKMDRKTMAKELHKRVCEMREKYLARQG